MIFMTFCIKEFIIGLKEEGLKHCNVKLPPFFYGVSLIYKDM